MKEKGKTLPKRTLGGTAFKHARAYRGVYLMATPILVSALIFYYIPMFGIRYAFFTYKGINDPIFVGIKHFVKMFSMPGFWKAFSNTLVLSITKLILNTGAAVIISVLLNELIFLKLKKVFQTIVYIPHFMSWVVAASIFSMILSPTSAGLVNDVLMKLHLITDNIYFLGDQKWWRFSYYIINVWKDTGWGTIIFMATLAGISPELYEAASMDGANRFQKMIYITLPALNNTIVTVLVLNLAKVMNLFESVFVLQNDAVIKVSDVLQTYIYTQTFNSGAIPDYGYTTAVGMFSSIISCILVLVCNRVSHKTRGRGIV